MDSSDQETNYKTTRASVACDFCRDSKLKCLNNNDNSRCKRCTKLDLSCAYTLKKSQLKKRKLSKDYILAHERKNYRNPQRDSKERDSKGDSKRDSIDSKDHQRKKRSKLSLSFNPTPILPSKSTILEVAEIYFENQYRGIFPLIHKPTFISFITSRDFNPKTYFQDFHTKYGVENYTKSIVYPDPVLILAIFALCVRLHPEVPKMYGGFDEENFPETFVPTFDIQNIQNDIVDNDTNNASSNASNYFGWHARNMLKEVFDSPTIQRVQALTMLSSHEWGEGHASRSYLYVGIAARMTLILGLGTEEGLLDDADAKLDESSRFICIESKRRTIWGVYMMDKCNSSGRNRSSCIRIDEIKVKLPCQEKDFLFGNFIQKSLTFEEAQRYIPDPLNHKLLGKTSCFGFLIILFESWSKIAKWVGERDGKQDILQPWDPDSLFYQLSQELSTFKASLPTHLAYNSRNLEAHIAAGSAADFGYFHGLYYLCRIFLNREYFYCSPESFPKGWWIQQTTLLLESLDDLDSIRRVLKPINKMVVAPFTGFHVYTTAVSCLYFQAFPTKILEKYLDGARGLQRKYGLLATENMQALLSWKKHWGLGEGWYETCFKLQKKFLSMAEIHASAFQDDAIRHTMQDYGTGDIKEVYTPKYVRERNHMHILNLLTDDRTSPESDNSEPEVSGIGIDSPIMDFMNSLDLSTIFGSC